MRARATTAPLRAALARRPRRGLELPPSMALVSGDSTLFGSHEFDASFNPLEHDDGPISDWQVDKLREALDARGLVAMSTRKRAIEHAAGRQVESLRSLTRTEADALLSQLLPPPPPPPPRRNGQCEL